MTSNEILKQDLEMVFSKHYHRVLSDRMKRSWAVRKKKMLVTSIVNNCKV